MKVKYHNTFIKNFKKRFNNDITLKRRYQERLFLFIENSQNPILRDHGLKGKKINMRAFSITGDVRVLYYIEKEIAYFIDIRTHNQVY